MWKFLFGGFAIIGIYGSAFFIPFVAYGYAMSVMWGWFVVPTFDVPELSIVAAIGIAMLIGYTTHRVDADKIDEWLASTRDPHDVDTDTFMDKLLKDSSIHDGKLSEDVMRFVILGASPLFVLPFGWVVHLFM